MIEPELARQVQQLLDLGYPYRSVRRATGAAMATISRIKRLGVAGRLKADHRRRKAARPLVLCAEHGIRVAGPCPVCRAQRARTRSAVTLGSFWADQDLALELKPAEFARYLPIRAAKETADCRGAV